MELYKKATEKLDKTALRKNIKSIKMSQHSNNEVQNDSLGINEDEPIKLVYTIYSIGNEYIKLSLKQKEVKFTTKMLL